MPETITLASPSLIGAVNILPSTATETTPVAPSKPVTITVASSPIVIGSALACKVKFFLPGTGRGFTTITTEAEALL